METTIPVFCQTGWQRDSPWGNDEKWEIVDRLVRENEICKNADDLNRSGYLNIRIGDKNCYVKKFPAKKEKLKTEIQELETVLKTLNCEDQLFWDHFLEEENFNKLVKYGLLQSEIPSRKEMYLLLPPENINYNHLPENYKTTIHQRREMTIRSNIHFGYQSSELNYLIKNSLKSIYIGVLEYSGYKEIESGWLIVSDEVTFTEHSMLGLEIG